VYWNIQAACVLKYSSYIHDHLIYYIIAKPSVRTCIMTLLISSCSGIIKASFTDKDHVATTFWDEVYTSELRLFQTGSCCTDTGNGTLDYLWCVSTGGGWWWSGVCLCAWWWSGVCLCAPKQEVAAWILININSQIAVGVNINKYINSPISVGVNINKY